MRMAGFQAGVDLDGEMLVVRNALTAQSVRVGSFELEDLELDATATAPREAVLALPDGIDAAATAPMDALGELLDERLTVRVDPLAFRHLDMPLRATLAVEYSGDLHGTAGVLPDFATLAEAASAELDVSMHKGLLSPLGAEELQPFLDAMIRQELVVESGDLYTLEATYQDGELTSNGRLVDLAVLLGILIAAQADA